MKFTVKITNLLVYCFLLLKVNSIDIFLTNKCYICVYLCGETLILKNNSLISS